MKLVYVVTESDGALYDQKMRAIGISVNLHEMLRKYDVYPICRYIDMQEFKQRFGIDAPELYNLDEADRLSACDYAVFVSVPNSEVPTGAVISINGVIAFTSISKLSDFLDSSR